MSFVMTPDHEAAPSSGQNEALKLWIWIGVQKMTVCSDGWVHTE